VPALADIGRVKVDVRHPNFWKATFNTATAQTAKELVAAPSAGEHLVLTDFSMSAEGTANTIKLVEKTASQTDIVEVIYLADNGNLSHNFKMPMALSSAVNLGFVSSVSDNHSVTVSGYTEPD